ncbi:TPA: TIGR03899 family protein [Photobacterium damselae]
MDNLPFARTSSSLISSKQRIERLAKQNYIAELINSSELSLIERLEHRERYLAQSKQNNLEQIIKLAHSYAGEENSRELDIDWWHHYLQLAQDIYSPQMQKVWAKALIQETLNPHSISLKALQTLAQLTHYELAIFKKALNTCWQLGKQDNNSKLLSQVVITNKRLFSNQYLEIDLLPNTLTVSMLMILMEAGLLLKTELSTKAIAKNSALTLSKGQHTYQLLSLKTKSTFSYYRLSIIGQELEHLLGEHDNSGYRKNIIDTLSRHFQIESDKHI